MKKLLISFLFLNAIITTSLFAQERPILKSDLLSSAKLMDMQFTDAEIEDYYNELYEDSEGSPEYGTALEHPKETRNIPSEDIPKHKHKKDSKYNR